jgi:hypothetical protein
MAMTAFGHRPDVKPKLTNRFTFKVGGRLPAELSSSPGVSLRAGLSAKLKPRRVFTHPGVHP